MRRRKRRRKLKKWVKILIVIIFLISLFLTFLCFKTKKVKKNTSSNNISLDKVTVSDILDKIDDEMVDKEFLEWYKEKYELKKVDDYLKNNNYSKSMWHKVSGKSLLVLKDLQMNIYDEADNVSMIDSKSQEVTFSFVGDVSLADNWYIMPEYDKRAKGIYGILDKNIVDIMTKSDVMIANNEFTISDRGEKMPKKYYTFRGSPKRLSIYKEMGVDLVTLANNHVYDFGSIAFNDMLDALKKYKIPYIGAGKNINEASKPYYYIAGGYKIGLINATRAEKFILTPGATDTSEGIFRCYEIDKLVSVIKEMKSTSDYVILLIHWGKEDSHDLEQVQIDTSKKYIDAGVDVIVGSHAHVLQGFEFYNNKFISYNLGDFIFNNETKDTGILQVNIDNEGRLKYKFIPCQEKDEYTKILSGDDKTNVLNSLMSWSRGKLKIDNDGYILETN